MKSSTLKLVQSALAALMVVAGAGNLAELMPARVAAWFTLLVGAASVGVGYYTAHAGTMPADYRGQYESQR